MTKSEKYGALGYAALAVLIAIVTRHWKGSSLLFAFGLPAVMYALSVWFGRALSARWDDQSQTDEIIYTKPMSFRLLFGFLALVILIAGVGCVMKSQSVGEEIFTLSLFGSMSLLLLAVTSYYRLRLNLVTRQYTLTRGFPSLKRTVSGSFDDCTVLAFKTNNRASQVRFCPHGSKWGFPVACYLPSEELSNQAYRIADKLGLSVEQRGQGW